MLILTCIDELVGDSKEELLNHTPQLLTMNLANISGIEVHGHAARLLPPPDSADYKFGATTVCR